MGGRGDRRTGGQPARRAARLALPFPEPCAGCLLAFGEARLLAAPGRAAWLACGLLALSLAIHPHLLFLFGPHLVETGPWIDPRHLPVVWLVHSGALCTGIVLLAVLAGQRFPHNLLTLAPLRAVGRISYGLYLYHLPIYYAVLLPRQTPAMAALAVGLSFAAAGISHVVVEAPIQRFASRFRAEGGTLRSDRPSAQS